AMAKGEAEWHCIGSLQRNKVKKAVEVFDCIQTLDSMRLAEEIGKRCESMRCLVQVNIGRERQKGGVLPESLAGFLKEAASLPGLKIEGLMAIEPAGQAELARPYFRQMKLLFDGCKTLGLANVQMRWLSMGMSNSYQIAAQEGSSMVRIGTAIFGPRERVG
ncbi:MAG: YggS family pyridoxal phosphate-dependent enzyme, partial [Candidatus Aenigmarchaeota archaeon]|nr:YggS family pyridoxal phosphate-dependent enzyme [Candidatus Aenigmarchaeota archaeon]